MESAGIPYDLIVLFVGLGLVCAYLAISPYYRRYNALRTWRKLLDQENVLILATEATGDSSRDEVTEVAAIDTTGVSRFIVYVQPQHTIPSADSKDSDVTLGKLGTQIARRWPEIHGEFVGLLSSAKRIIAYDVKLHRWLLKQSAERHGLRLPGKEWVDAQKGYEILRPFGRSRLVDAMRREEVQVQDQPHRSTYGCQCVLAVMRAVVARHV